MIREKKMIYLAIFFLPHTHSFDLFSNKRKLIKLCLVKKGEIYSTK